MNEKHYCMCPMPEDLTGPDNALASKSRAALLKFARWETGSVITVKFLGGSQALQQRVRKVAEEWLKVANLKFEFVADGETDIRIAFIPGNGSWSYLGTVCRQIPANKPTMNYGWLTDASPETELRRVVLHEFGHAIGLIHEHQNPKNAIKWNKDAVIHDLSGPPNNWNLAQIETNMFKFYAPGEVTATEVDPISIMMYPIPQSWTVGGFSAGLNGELSEADKQLVKSVYPS